MTREKPQKIKLLCIADLLRYDTDAKHPMKTEELCNRLGELGIKCDRRVLTEDIKILQSFGYQIVRCKVGCSYAYYIDQREFELSEIKIILDALQAASFIPESKTYGLSMRLASLAGIFSGELLKEGLVSFNSRKHTNDEVYDTVGFLNEALQSRHQVSFRYFFLDENKERVYQKNGERYIVDPVMLVYNEDYYYLVTYSIKHKDVVTYRIDRMSDVQVEDTLICKNIVSKIERPGRITEQTFKMFNGKAVKAVLEFDNSLMGSVYDKFGEKIDVTRIDARTCRVNVIVRVSPTFWGWLFGFGNKMRIISPKVLIDEYLKRCIDIIKNLKTEP